jgi:predicted MFS family arabinose efflux permease
MNKKLDLSISLGIIIFVGVFLSGLINNRDTARIVDTIFLVLAIVNLILMDGKGIKFHKSKDALKNDNFQ